jgi:hypothetical protein
MPLAVGEYAGKFPICPNRLKGRFIQIAPETVLVVHIRSFEIDKHPSSMAATN